MAEEVEVEAIDVDDESVRTRCEPDVPSDVPANTSAEATSAGPVERNHAVRGSSRDAPDIMALADKMRGVVIGLTTPELPTMVAETGTIPVMLPKRSAAATGQVRHQNASPSATTRYENKG